MPSSNRCSTTPGTLRGSTRRSLVYYGIGERTSSATSLNLIFLFVCLIIFSICFPCPLLTAIIPFWTLPSLLSNQQEKHHTGRTILKYVFILYDLSNTNPITRSFISTETRALDDRQKKDLNPDPDPH